LNARHPNLTNVVVFSLPLLLILPLIFQYGVFFDGALYSAYARNLSEGVGSFWNTLAWPGATSPVRDQPPLAFFLQSFFFKAFGNQFFVEGLYGLCCLYLTLGGVLRLNTALPSRTASGATASGTTSQPAWPALLFLTIPIVLWSARNNMIENTLTVLTTWATFFAISATFATSRTRAFLHTIAFAAILVAAFLTKGPVALFPLAVPFLARLVFHFSEWRNPKHILRNIAHSATLPAATLAAFALLWLVPDFRNFTHAYFREQILPSSMGARESSGSHFTIVLALINNAGIPVAATLALAFFTKNFPHPRAWFKHPTTASPASNSAHQHALFWFLVFLSAWTPFLISTKQMPWYLIPSLPFLCLALPAAAPRSFHTLSTWLSTIRARKILMVVLAILLVSGPSLATLSFGRVYKNESFYNSFLPLINTLPTRTQYGVCNAALLREWRMVTPLLRYFQSPVTHNASPSGIWILQNSDTPCFNTNGCQLLNHAASPFQVYACSTGDAAP
jgi:hypothetical protein